MSEPKRYDRREIYDVTYQAAGDECLPEPSENGEFVRWEDYARLKAEVERLRKAGDFMQKSMLECGPNEMADAFHHDEWWASYNGWTIAKSHQS